MPQRGRKERRAALFRVLRIGMPAGLFVALATTVTAQPRDFEVAGVRASAEEAELARLMSLLEEETELVTKTRMNADYVPGIVTVLQGDELEALGARTVWDALALVPGIQIARSGTGGPTLVMRGLAFPFNNSNVKVLINSVSVSRESAGINAFALLIPIEQVERIEVIRGPGSILYGDFALMGLVNIVTRSEGTRVYASADDADTYNAGFGHEWSLGGREASMVLHADVEQSDQPWLPKGRSGSEDRMFAGLEVRAGGLHLLAQGLRYDLDSPGSSGGGSALPARDHSWTLEGRYHRDLSSSTALDVNVDVHQNLLEDPGTLFDGKRAGVGLDFHWNGAPRQQWLFGVEAVRSDISRFAHSLTPPPGVPPPPRTVLRDLERQIASLLVEDQIELSSDLTATLGLRYDDYDDVDRRVTPRLALAWRASDHQIFKIQYAEGFRAPTYFELYDPRGRRRDLSFEVNTTSELNYVYRRPATVFRATVFRSRLHDMIFPASREMIFSNSRRASSTGVEVELEQRLSDRLKLLANMSWADAQDSRPDPAGRLIDSYDNPALLANLSLIYQPRPKLTVAARWNHVGDRETPVELGAVDRGFDLGYLTVTVHDLFPGGKVRLGVENLFDQRVSYLFTRPDGLVSSSLFDRRVIWLRVSWSR